MDRVFVVRHRRFHTMLIEAAFVSRADAVKMAKNRFDNWYIEAVPVLTPAAVDHAITA